MNRNSLLGAVRLVLLLTLLTSPAWSKELHPEVTTIQISKFNDAQLSPNLISGAEKVATRIFAQAGVNLEWLSCGLLSMTDSDRTICIESFFPTHLHLRLVGHPVHLGGTALGVSYLAEDGVGFQADIFCDRVAALQSGSLVDPAILLGIVMAHELGHLLLGTGSHSPSGLMRGSWHREDLLRAIKGTLLFSDDQSDHMRAKLFQAYLDRKGAGLVLASHK